MRETLKKPTSFSQRAWQSISCWLDIWVLLATTVKQGLQLSVTYFSSYTDFLLAPNTTVYFLFSTPCFFIFHSALWNILSLLLLSDNPRNLSYLNSFMKLSLVISDKFHSTSWIYYYFCLGNWIVHLNVQIPKIIFLIIYKLLETQGWVSASRYYPM